MSALAALVSPTRQAVLTATFLQPAKSWYLSELAAHIGTTPSSLQRDVNSFVQTGILEKRVDGRRIYVKANEESPIFADICGLVEKTNGIVPLLSEALNALKNKVRCGFIYGSVARGEERVGSDVDLMLIGNVSMLELVPLLRRIEKAVARQINPTIFTDNDLARTFASGNHFLLTVMRGDKIMLKGTQDEFDAFARGAKDSLAPVEQARVG